MRACDGSGVVGYGTVVLVGPEGEVKAVRQFRNLITTAGDEYHVKKIITGISPANPSAPAAASGMKLGTSSTAAAKSGAGAALGTYTSGSNQSFDATYPQAAAVAGTDTGWVATYQCTWAAGDVTQTGLAEAVIVNDAGTDATSSAPNTYARVVFTAVDKGAGDSLTITWNHKQLGA